MIINAIVGVPVDSSGAFAGYERMPAGPRATGVPASRPASGSMSTPQAARPGLDDDAMPSGTWRPGCGRRPTASAP
jgi:hypothetical protein